MKKFHVSFEITLPDDWDVSGVQALIRHALRKVSRLNETSDIDVVEDADNDVYVFQIGKSTGQFLKELEEAQEPDMIDGKIGPWRWYAEHQPKHNRTLVIARHEDEDGTACHSYHWPADITKEQIEMKLRDELTPRPTTNQ